MISTCSDCFNLRYGLVLMRDFHLDAVSMMADWQSEEL
jgi:hypothetical protein